MPGSIFLSILPICGMHVDIHTLTQRMSTMKTISRLRSWRLLITKSSRHHLVACCNADHAQREGEMMTAHNDKYRCRFKFSSRLEIIAAIPIIRTKYSVEYYDQTRIAVVGKEGRWSDIGDGAAGIYSEWGVSAIRSLTLHQRP